MRKVIIVLLAAISFVDVFSQPSINTEVKGRVINGDEQVPFENVTIAVYSLPDSTITTGVVTDQDGVFAISQLPAGEYNLTASFVGYRSKSFNFMLTDTEPVFNVGDIILVESSEDIGSVNVVAVKPQIIYRDNKKILKVKEFQDAGSSTLSEVLENAPSVTLDSEGNVLLRGSSNYTLLIDGKPVPGAGLNMLRQIPPEMVEDIEIMTNPSARYDPDGVTGIINLVLKKQTESGMNGMLSLMAGLGDKYNGDGQFNYRKNKLNVFAGLTGTSYATDVEGTFYRQINDVSESSEISNSFGQDTKIGTMIGNLGADYTLNERNSISLSGRFGPQDIDVLVDNGLFRDVDDPSLSGDFNFTNRLRLNGVFYVPSLTWDHKFKKEGSKLQTSLFVGGFQGTLRQEMNEEVLDAAFEPTGVYTDQKILDNDMDINDVRFSADYENTIEGKGKIELGYQYRRLFEKNNHTLTRYDNDIASWVEDPVYTSNIGLDRAIQSVYSTWAGDLGKYNYQAGLRAEYTMRTIGDFSMSDDNEYNRFSLFPSASLTRTLKNNQQLQLSYSRRINRPGRNQLSPIPQYADNQLIVTGNPDLKPEFVDSYELSYQNQVKAGFLSLEAYYRRVNDMITNVITPEEGGVMRQHVINANRSHSAGTELMANLQPVKWARLIASGNVYYYYLDDEQMYEENDNSSVIWTSNLTTVLLPTPSTRFTITGIYNGPSITLQGTQKSSYMINMGLRQELFKRKASVALSVRDVFRSFRYENEFRGEGYITTTSIRPEAQVTTITFTYNFNNYRRRAQTDEMDLNFIR